MTEQNEDGFTISIVDIEDHVLATWLQAGLSVMGKTRVDALRALADTLVDIDDWAQSTFDSKQLRDHSSIEESFIYEECVGCE